MTDKNNTGDRSTGNWNTGDRNTGDRSTGNCNTGYWNTGDCNTGNRNTGNWNTGDRSTGNCNTGNWNTGDRSTGNCNTGNRNTGDCNTGYWNTGDRNTGDSNTGYWNTGDRNTGYWNTGDCNTGYCNTITPDECLIFNKPSTRTLWDECVKPNWMYVDLTKWILESNMSDKEKEANPTYVTTGGYLKFYTSLKQAYIEAWEKTTEEDRKLTEKLPNFDPVVFEEVFGFNPFKKQKTEVTLTLTDEQLKQVKELIGE
jgi:hypothetical protein